MAESSENGRRIAVRVTDLDRRAVDLMKACGGWIRVDTSGNPALETDTQIGPGRLRRLECLGLAEPANDALIPGEPSQTYRLTDKAHMAPA